MKLITQTLILLFTSLNLLAQYSEPLTVAEQMPYFSGCKDLVEGSKEKRDCSNRKLISFISQNLQYPAEAKVKGAEGAVFVSFIVREDGKIVEPTILHDIGNNCGLEAIRVLKMMPDFEPGQNEGEEVSIKLTLPIRFTLETTGDDKSSEYNLSWGALNGGKVTRDELRKNLYNTIQIRNKNGDELLVNELTFSFEKDDKIISEKSRGEVNKGLIKVVARAKSGGVFRIIANFQESGEFIYVDRAFEVTE